MTNGKRIYFLSDFHLGVPDHARSLEREKRIVAFLHEATRDAAEIHILGDLFDMWFEYRKAVPRGFVRLLGTMAELSDRGIPVHLYTGNHDMWIFDYLPKETGVILHRTEVEREWNGKRFLIGHGDGLGPGDHGYKFIKRVFRSKVCQWLFARMHPNLGLGIADFWSGRSRRKNYVNDRKFLGSDNEWLAIHCRELLTRAHYDYFIFGHRHLPLDLRVGPNSRYVNLGDWITWFTYAVFDGQDLRLMERVGDGPLALDKVTKGAGEG